MDEESKQMMRAAYAAVAMHAILLQDGPIAASTPEEVADQVAGQALRFADALVAKVIAGT